MAPQTGFVIHLLMLSMCFCQQIPMRNQYGFRSRTTVSSSSNRNTNRIAGFNAPRPFNIPCGRSQKCVPSYLCLNGTLNTGGAFSIDLRIDSPCPNGEICCFMESDIDNAQLSDSKISTSNYNLRPRRPQPSSFNRNTNMNTNWNTHRSTGFSATRPSNIPCGRSQKCVPMYLCPNGILNTGGASLSGLRFESTCRNGEICCTVEPDIDNPQLSASKISTSNDNLRPRIPAPSSFNRNTNMNTNWNAHRSTGLSAPRPSNIPCGRSQKCVPMYLCPNGILNTGGASLSGIRYESTCRNGEICCTVKPDINNAQHSDSKISTSNYNRRPRIPAPSSFNRNTNMNTNWNAHRSTGFSAPRPSNIPCGRSQKCIPSYLCLNGTLNTGGAFSIDLRIESPCPNGEICCTVESDSNDAQRVEAKIPTRNQHLRPDTTQTSSLNTNTNRSTVFNAPRPSNIPCGRSQKCVPSYLCLNGTLNTGGAFSIDLRIESPCPNGEICCTVEMDINDAQHKEESKIVQALSSCGYRNIGGVDVKAEQNDMEAAEFGEFPWVIAILLEEVYQGLSSYTQKCGGSLITPGIALTSANCVRTRPMESFIVRAGEWELNSVAERIPHQDRKIIEIIVHPEFKKVRNYNDIAILFLEAAFNLAPNVNTVCLPPAHMNFDFARCYAAGWGQEKNFRNSVMKKIELPVVPHSQCQENFRRTHLGASFVLHSSFLCAGGEGGKDTCKGDGGSPLVCPIKGTTNRYYQVGIVSWGIGCGQKNLPGAYASLPWLRTWIDEILIRKGLKSTYFTP